MRSGSCSSATTWTRPAGGTLEAFFFCFCLGLVEVRTPFLFIYVGISYGGGYASTEFSG